MIARNASQMNITDQGKKTKHANHLAQNKLISFFKIINLKNFYDEQRRLLCSSKKAQPLRFKN